MGLNLSANGLRRVAFVGSSQDQLNKQINEFFDSNPSAIVEVINSNVGSNGTVVEIYYRPDPLDKIVGFGEAEPSTYLYNKG